MIPWRREWQPTAGFLPGEFHGQRTWWATGHGVTKSQTRLKRQHAYIHNCAFGLLGTTEWGRVNSHCTISRKGLSQWMEPCGGDSLAQIQDCCLLHPCPLQACLLVYLEAYDTWQHRVHSTALPALQALIWIRISFSGPLGWAFSPPLKCVLCVQSLSRVRLFTNP